MMTRPSPDDAALDAAILHATEVADRQCGSACGDDHRRLVAWLTELKSRRVSATDGDFLAVAFQHAAAEDREGFDLFLELLPEEGRELVRALAEQTVFEEIRQRSLPKREFPFRCWHTEIRVILERLMGPAGGTGGVGGA